MTYYTDPEKRKQIDALLKANASYQAANNCITNSKARHKEINRHCNREFIHPIKQIDSEFYEHIKKQND
jgi:hypothetical protein